MAKKIVDEIANVSSSYIGDKMEVIPPKIIEVGKIATERTSPSVMKNSVIGFFCLDSIIHYSVYNHDCRTCKETE